MDSRTAAPLARTERTHCPKEAAAMQSPQNPEHRHHRDRAAAARVRARVMLAAHRAEITRVLAEAAR